MRRPDGQLSPGVPTRRIWSGYHNPANVLLRLAPSGKQRDMQVAAKQSERMVNASMQEQGNATPPPETETFLSALVGTFIMVHTLADGHGTSAGFRGPQAANIYGRLEFNYPDTLVLETVEQGQPNGGKILIYKRAIVAIETRGTMSP